MPDCRVPSYYEADRTDLLPFIPERIERALDVGCASGTFGLLLKGRGAIVWGIEPTEAAERAATRLDKVFHGTFREVENELPSGGFDLVSFTDVLEHMHDCFAVLRDVKRLLSPEGQVLACLPNLRYWPAFMRLAWHGDFPYEDSGIFDRTHLRFFTRSSMLRMFGECGYEVTRCEGIHSMVGPKLRLANLLTCGKFADCACMQYVILARPR